MFHRLEIVWTLSPPPNKQIVKFFELGSLTATMVKHMLTSTDLRPNLEAIYVPLKLTRQKMTLIPPQKFFFIYLKPFLLYSLSTIVDSRSQCI